MDKPSENIGVKGLKRTRQEMFEENFGYTDEQNPFNDPSLSEFFVWDTKFVQNNKALRPTAASALHETNAKLEEIERVKRRREMQEREEHDREESKAISAREKAEEEFESWEARERRIAVHQTQLKSRIRIKNGRETDLDLLAKTALAADGQVEDHALLPSKVFEGAVDTWVEKIPLTEFEEVIQQVQAHALAAEHLMVDEHLIVGGGQTVAAPWRPSVLLGRFWAALAVLIVAKRKEKTRRAEWLETYGSAMEEDISKLPLQVKVEAVLGGLGESQLDELFVQVRDKIGRLASKGADVHFWQAVQGSVPVFRARLVVDQILESGRRAAEDIKLADQKRRRAEVLGKLQAIAEQQEQTRALMEELGHFQGGGSSGHSPLLVAQSPPEFEAAPLFAVDDLASQALVARRRAADRKQPLLARWLPPVASSRSELPIECVVLTHDAAEARRRDRFVRLKAEHTQRVEFERRVAEVRASQAEKRRTQDAFFDAFVARESKFSSDDMHALGDEVDLAAPQSAKNQKSSVTSSRGDSSLAATASAEDYFKSMGVSQQNMRGFFASEEAASEGKKKQRRGQQATSGEGEFQPELGLAGLLGVRHRLNDNSGDLAFLRTGVSAAALQMQREGHAALRGLDEAELAERFRPRKPRYFNRVKTGFEWNKYNQAHYDYDNPPPKVVQGYKFNIFYPDLLDPTQVPTYRVEPCPEDEDSLILRFTAGPPYEDVAFKIVNKEWDKHSGFQCTFEKGMMQLHFLLRRAPYKK